VGWAAFAGLSAFASAEMATPRLVEHRIANLAVKQRGRDVIERVGILLESLGFEVGISAGSIRVEHRLRPLGVAMAGRDVYDPYKD